MNVDVTLPDGRILVVEDHDFTPAFPGSYHEPPESAEVDVTSAYWGPDGAHLTESELTWLHEDEATYIAVLNAVKAAHDKVDAEEVWAADGDHQDAVSQAEDC